MRSLSALLFALLSTGLPLSASDAQALSLTQHRITWTFAEARPFGTFANGDYWVVGPVDVVAIANDLNHPDFPPMPGQNGAMVNPRGDQPHGYDVGHEKKGGYRADLNAARPNGQALSADNPLRLLPGQSLVMAVSWVYRDRNDREPGCPKWHLTETPRPALRSAAVLTCLAEAPPPNAFRPPYCGDDKRVRYTTADLRRDRLAALASVDGAPSFRVMADRFAGPWLDHYPGWMGEAIHPSIHMPPYGREISQAIARGALMLQFDPARLAEDERPHFDRLLVNFVQLGLDLAAVADNGGRWEADGGHGAGRKLPILFAGALLGDEHLLNAGHWETAFQEDEQTFFIDQTDVDRTRDDPKWAPDKRRPAVPFPPEAIGLPEWGIRHAHKPRSDNYNWQAIYRDVNNASYPAHALAAHIMGLREAWNHEAFFEYADLVMQTVDWHDKRVVNKLPAFFQTMWKTYRGQFDTPPKTYTRPPEPQPRAKP